MKFLPLILALILSLSLVSALNLSFLTDKNCSFCKVNFDHFEKRENNRLYFANYSNSNNLEVLSTPSVKFVTMNEPLMIFYTNGTIWVREGSEQEAGEQLAKVLISTKSFMNGYCEGRR